MTTLFLQVERLRCQPQLFSRLCEALGTCAAQRQPQTKSDAASAGKLDQDVDAYLALVNKTAKQGKKNTTTVVVFNCALFAGKLTKLPANKRVRHKLEKLSSQLDSARTDYDTLSTALGINAPTRAAPTSPPPTVPTRAASTSNSVAATPHNTASTNTVLSLEQVVNEQPRGKADMSQVRGARWGVSWVDCTDGAMPRATVGREWRRGGQRRALVLDQFVWRRNVPSAARHVCEGAGTSGRCVARAVDAPSSHTRCLQASSAPAASRRCTSV